MIYLYHPPPPWSDRREECSQRGTNSPEKDHQPDLLACLGKVHLLTGPPVITGQSIYLVPTQPLVDHLTLRLY